MKRERESVALTTGESVPGCGVEDALIEHEDPTIRSGQFDHSWIVP
jgi:hypothetical protein